MSAAIKSVGNGNSEQQEKANKAGGFPPALRLFVRSDEARTAANKSIVDKATVPMYDKAKERLFESSILRKKRK